MKAMSWRRHILSGFPQVPRHRRCFNGRLPSYCAMHRMRPPLIPRLLVPRLPFFYGWVVLACICLAGFARQGPAVAVLSVFVVPMTEAFGWSRTEIAGAVSLGGVLAAVVSPMLGPML